MLISLGLAAAIGIRVPAFFPDAAHARAATFIGGDGRRHVRLGGYDSYYWLQLSRTKVATGTPCDRVDAGACIDAYGNAPAGETIDYRHSPHTGAIAIVQGLLEHIDPGIPLSTSAMIVPVVVAAAGAIAAYILGTLAAGSAGGLIAAVLVSCNPVVLGRTIEGDDDIWIVVLPLFVCCATALALRSPRASVTILWSAIAGALLGLTACAWDGWPFFAFVTLAGTAVAGLARRDRSALLVAGVAVVSLALCVFAASVPVNGAAFIAQALRFAGLASHAGHVVSAPMPNTFAAVAELQDVDASLLVDAVGLPAFALALAGIVLAAALRLPSVRARFAGTVAVTLVAAGIVVALTFAHAQRSSALVAACVAVAGAAFFSRRNDVLRSIHPAWYLLVTWFVLALLIGFDALRYVVLVAVPVTLLAGASAGALLRAITPAAAAPVPRRMLGAVAAAAIVALTLSPALAQGVKLVRTQEPEINAAWIATLHDIRDHEPASAIVNVWWTHGHWAKYFSRRAVSNDGATLRSTTNYWLALALAAPSGAESERYLRMIDCGEVRDPLTGERSRPYETLVRWLGDEAAAYVALTALMQSAPVRHQTLLARTGLSAARRTALLQTIDCTPRPAMLLLSTGLLADPSWYLDGFWDPYRAYLIEAVRTDPSHAASDAARRYGRPLAATQALAGEAAAVRDEAQRDTFASPHQRAPDISWTPCTMARALLRCPSASGTVYVDPANPAHVALLTATGQVPLSFAKVIRASGIATVIPARSNPAGPAVLADASHFRIFLGDPKIVRSTLVRLALADDRTDPVFAPASTHVADDGEVVSSWRVRWSHTAGPSYGGRQ